MTTPVTGSIANLPPASSTKLYATGSPSGSVATAVIPTAVPTAAPSITRLIASSLSTGASGGLFDMALVPRSQPILLARTKPCGNLSVQLVIADIVTCAGPAV